MYKLIKYYNENKCAEFEDLFVKVGCNLSLISLIQGKYIPAIYSALLVVFAMPKSGWKPYFRLAKALTVYDESPISDDQTMPNYKFILKYIALKYLLIAESLKN